MNLVKILENYVDQSDSTASEVGEQRERNYRYYTSQPLGNEQKGRSHHITPVVFDAVEHKKTVFHGAFLTSRHPVRFKECHYPFEAASKTEYVRKQLRRNKYHRLFRDGWHDAFVGKRMVIVADWEPTTATEVLQLNMTPGQVVGQQLQQFRGRLVDVDDSEVQQVNSPMGTLYSGALRLEVAEGEVALDLVAPEDWFRDDQAAELDDSLWATRLRRVAKGMLIAEGFDYDQVMGLKSDYRFERTQEEQARRRHDKGASRRHMVSRDTDSQEEVSLFRTWVWLSDQDNAWDDLDGFEPAEGFNLYEVYWCSGEVLRRQAPTPEEGQEPQPGEWAIRQVEEIPAFEWTEYKISHASDGLCTADVLAGAQKTESTIKRLVLDNNHMRNNPDRQILLGALKRPADATSTAIGKNIFVRRPDAITPVPSNDLDPSTPLVLQMIRQDREMQGGVTDLGKGMSTDAVRYQNADHLIERLSARGDARTAMAANDFATTFLIPLYQFIVTLGMRHDQSSSSMEIAGQQVPIAPQQWQDDELEMEPDDALSPEQVQKQVQGFLTMHSMKMQDPQMAISYGVRQRHALFDRVYELMGVSDTTPYMLSPDSPQYEQAAQAQQQQAQQQQAQQAQMAQFQMGLLQSQEQRQWEETRWKLTDGLQDNARADRKVRNDEVQFQKSHELEREKVRKSAAA